MHIDDDYIFHSNKWDDILIKNIEEKGMGWGLAYGKDINASGKTPLPIAPIYSGKIIKVLGHFIHPIFEHNCADVYQKTIGEVVGCFYDPNVVVEHRHFPMDDNYRLVAANLHKGTAQYQQWEKEFKDEEIKKLQDAMK
jgi:hypothetical protein